MKKLITMLAASAMLVGLASCGQQPVTYTVTYDANGATSGTVPVDDTKYSPKQEVLVLGNIDLQKEEFTFVGWNTQADGEGEDYIAGSTFNIEANTTLYAQWTPILYTVTYDKNSDQATGEVPVDAGQYTKNQQATVLAGSDLTWLYNQIESWNTKADGTGDSYAPGDKLTVLGDTTLYAIWGLKEWDGQVLDFLSSQYNVTADLSSLVRICDQHDVHVTTLGDTGEGSFGIVFYNDVDDQGKECITDALFDALRMEIFGNAKCWSVKEADTSRYEDGFLQADCFGKFNDSAKAATMNIKMYRKGNYYMPNMSKVVLEFSADTASTADAAIEAINEFVTANGGQNKFLYDDGEFADVAPAFFVTREYTRYDDAFIDDLVNYGDDYQAYYDEDYDCVSGLVQGTVADCKAGADDLLINLLGCTALTAWTSIDGGAEERTYSDANGKLAITVQAYNYYGNYNFFDIYVEQINPDDLMFTGVSVVTNNDADTLNRFINVVNKDEWDINVKLGDLFGNFVFEKEANARDGQVVMGNFTTFYGAFSLDLMFTDSPINGWPQAKLDAMMTGFTNKLPGFDDFMFGENMIYSPEFFGFLGYDQGCISDNPEDRLDYKYAQVCQQSGNFDVELIPNYYTSFGIQADTYVITGKEVVNNKYVCLEAFAYGDITVFAVSFLKSWVKDEVDALTAAFTTEVPQPEDRGWAIASISVPGELVVAFTNTFAAGAAENYLSLFDETLWNVSTQQSSGLTIYIADSIEQQEIGGVKKVIEVSWYASATQFVIYVELVDAPTPWPEEDVAEFTKAFTTEVPTAGGNGWLKASSSTASRLILFTTQFEADADDEYAAKFDTQLWDIAYDEQDESYRALSKEVVLLQPYVYAQLSVYFYIYQGQFVVQISRVQASVDWFGGYIDAILANGGITQTTVPQCDLTGWVFNTTYCVDGYSVVGQASTTDDTCDEAYAAKFSSDDWDISYDASMDEYTMTSKEIGQGKDGKKYQVVVYFYYWNKKMLIQVLLQEYKEQPAGKITFPTDNVNGALEEQGWGDAGYDLDFSSLGEIWTLVEEINDAPTGDGWGQYVLTLTYQATSNSDLNEKLNAILTLMMNSNLPAFYEVPEEDLDSDQLYLAQVYNDYFYVAVVVVVYDDGTILLQIQIYENY